MINLIQLKCSNCQLRGAIYFPIRAAYRMPDGNTLDVGQAMAWCSTCNGVADVEVLPQIDVIERLLQLHCFTDPGHPASHADVAKLRRYLVQPRLPNVSLLALGTEAWSPQRFVTVREFLERQRQFLQLRQAPARCLTCATSNFGPVSHWRRDDPPMIHPTCGGTIKFRGGEPGNMNPVELSVECERLG